MSRDSFLENSAHYFAFLYNNLSCCWVPIFDYYTVQWISTLETYFGTQTSEGNSLEEHSTSSRQSLAALLVPPSSDFAFSVVWLGARASSLSPHFIHFWVFSSLTFPSGYCHFSMPQSLFGCFSNLFSPYLVLKSLGEAQVDWKQNEGSRES